MVDCGVDLDRFVPGDAEAARAELGWLPGGTAFVCVGSLSERKNVLRLARRFARRGEGSLAFVGDGPLRGALEGRRGIHLAGAVPHDAVPRWLAAADVVCQPSLVEPFGLVTLEAMACGRSVVATSVGGPPEFVPPEAGVLVDPPGRGRARGRARARRGASPPEPTRAAQPSATTCAARPSGSRRCSSGRPGRPPPRAPRQGGLARGGGRVAAAAGGVDVVAEIRVPLDDDLVDDPPEDRADEAGRSGRSRGRRSRCRRSRGRGCARGSPTSR